MWIIQTYILIPLLFFSSSFSLFLNFFFSPFLQYFFSSSFIKFSFAFTHTYRRDRTPTYDYVTVIIESIRVSAIHNSPKYASNSAFIAIFIPILTSVLKILCSHRRGPYFKNIFVYFIYIFLQFYDGIWLPNCLRNICVVNVIYVHIYIFITSAPTP